VLVLSWRSTTAWAAVACSAATAPCAISASQPGYGTACSACTSARPSWRCDRFFCDRPFRSTGRGGGLGHLYRGRAGRAHARPTARHASQADLLAERLAHRRLAQVRPLWLPVAAACQLTNRKNARSSATRPGAAAAVGEPNSCLHDALCTPFSSHGASIRQPFGAGHARGAAAVARGSRRAAPLRDVAAGADAAESGGGSGSSRSQR
jgi:hypothetical protein